MGGGSAANAAVAARRLGADVTLVAPLGDDLIGDLIRRDLARDGVDVRPVIIPGATSPVVSAIVDGAGERTVLTYAPQGAPPPPVPDPAGLVAGFDAVLADDRFPDFARPVLEAARALGRPAVFDGDRAAGLPLESLAVPSHLVFSGVCLAGTTGLDDPAAGLRAARRHTDAMLAVTLGARGTLWLDGDAVRHVPATAVTVVDTLGAGDVFHGAFTVALVEGLGPDAALRFASAAAALKCTRFGGRDGAPDRATLDRFLATMPV